MSELFRKVHQLPFGGLINQNDILYPIRFYISDCNAVISDETQCLIRMSMIERRRGMLVPVDFPWSRTGTGSRYWAGQYRRRQTGSR